MVAINVEYMSLKSGSGHIELEGKSESATNKLPPFNSSNNTQRPDISFAAPSSLIQKAFHSPCQEVDKSVKGGASSHFDMPLLISDHDGEESEGESVNGVQVSNREDADSRVPILPATQEVKRSIKEEKAKEDKLEEKTETLQNKAPCVDFTERRAVGLTILSDTSLACTSAPSGLKETPEASEATPEIISCERNKVMKIVVKYVAMKITNSFPPPSARTVDPKEMPLDEYLMILVSRLQLSLPLFMKGIIYLFRYMDIIYLLRYVNQSNNFANYTDMGYGLKKLIIGCFRLVLARERKIKNWSDITGLSNAQINDIVRTVVGRLNGKLVIKNVELVKLRGEIFRFVKMVTKTI